MTFPDPDPVPQDPVPDSEGAPTSTPQAGSSWSANTARGGDGPVLGTKSPLSSFILFADGGKNAACGIGVNHYQVIRVKLAHGLVKRNPFLLQEGGERDGHAQFAVVTQGLFKIDALLFVFKLKFHRHGTEGTGLGVLRVAIIFVGLGGLTEEGHIAGAKATSPAQGHIAGAKATSPAQKMEMSRQCLRNRNFGTVNFLRK